MNEAIRIEEERKVPSFGLIVPNTQPDSPSSPKLVYVVPLRGGEPNSVEQLLDDLQMPRGSWDPRKISPDSQGAACFVMPITTGMNTTILFQRVQRLATCHPVIVLGESLSHRHAFSAGSAGAFEALSLPKDRTRVLYSIRRAWEQDEYSRVYPKQIDEHMPRLIRLSKRERDVMMGLAAGKNNKEVAAALGLSVKTIEFHRSRLMRKVRARNVFELIKLTLQEME